MNQELLNAYSQGKILLFIGAGVSSNLGLPTWSKLIDHIAESLDYDPEVFKSYGDFLALAEYYCIQKGGIGYLRSWMDREWHSSTQKIQESKIHKLIVNGNFPLIYTTNYDNWIEKACDYYNVDYNKIINVNDIANGVQSRREIVKFHGDFSDDNSIVLGETSYFERLDFNTPLDIKLRADSLGRTVLFIGYSLNDINTRYLFYKLTNLWKRYGGNFKKPQSFIFMPKPNPIQETVLKQWGIETITSDIDSPGEALTAFMEELVNSKG